MDSWFLFPIVIVGWSVGWFLLSIWYQRNDIADTAWGLFPVFLGFVIAQTTAVTSLWYLLYGLILVWGLRLAWHIGRRTLKKTAEDPRYKQWRDSWRYFYTRSFAQVFLLQTTLSFILCLPLVLATQKAEISGYNLLGIALFFFGFGFEVLADRQLKAFIQKKKAQKTNKKIMTEGLWAYSRHPNYFGEVILWWGIFLVAFDLEMGLWLLASPALITVLILKVSGVPMAEKRYQGDPEWEAYAKKTNAFFPWF